MLEPNDWVTMIFQIVGLGAIAIGALWAYTTYVLERGILTPAQLGIEVTPVGSLTGFTILEVLVHLKMLDHQP
jgi:hypothetical protein